VNIDPKIVLKEIPLEDLELTKIEFKTDECQINFIETLLSSLRVLFFLLLILPGEFEN